MSNSPIVVCPHCHTPNRVPIERLQGADSTGTCGRCKHALHTGTPIELDEPSFAAHVERSGIPLVVDFWAPWCGPCRMMVPAFAQAAATLGPAVQLAKLNTEEAPKVAARYNIRSIPTLILFRGGQELDRHSGAMDAASLNRWIRQHI